MKTFFRLLIITIFCTFCANEVKASHIAAADIYYEYISPLNYKLHLVLYRDCTGISLGGTVGINATSITCGQNLNFILDTTGNNTKQVYGDLCPNIQSQCSDPNSIYPGYEEWHYSANITLPMACKDWVFTFTTCCRNPAISNIVGPGGAGICISAGLNNLQRPINNSVFLSIKPIPYICVNQPKTYLNGPIDPDLDSLVFLATTPLTDAGCSPVTWFGTGVMASNPFGATAPAGYVVNSNSGTATFTPTQTNVFVMAYTCYEIDPNTGDTVGYVMRDVQLNVLNCNASPPSDPSGTQCYNILNLTGGSLQPATASNPCPNIITVCPGTPISFDVQSISNSPSNLLLSYANNAASCPGSTYSFTPIGGGSPITGTFNWTPNGSQIGTHTLIISFVDSTCTIGLPIVLKSYAVVQIKVLPGVDAGPDLNYCIGADSIQLNVTAPPSITQWSWTDINGSTSNLGLSSTSVKNPKAAPTQTTTYIVTALNPPAGLICKTIDTITITVVNGTVVVLSGGNHTICANDSVQLMGSATPAQINPTITWTPGITLDDSTILTPWAKPLVTTNYVLTFRDDNGCIYTRYADVTVNGARPILNALSSADNVCPGLPFQLFSNAATQPCGPSVFSCTTTPTFKTVGTGNISQGQYSPYYTYWYDGYKTQMLYTADELQAAGITAGNITSIAWNVLSHGSDSMRNMRISMGCTSATALDGTTGFLTGLSQVWYQSSYGSHVGWNTHNFANANGYYWDGTSNLVVQICYDVNGFNTNFDMVQSSNTPVIQVMHQNNYGVSGCNQTATNPLISTVRPNTRFKVCENGSYNFTWTPSATLSSGTDKDPYSSGIFNTTTFNVSAVSASNANCTSSDVVTVTVDNSNAITASATPQIICEPGLVTLTGTPVGTPPQYECGEENVQCSSPFNQYFSGIGALASTSLTPFNGNYAGGRTQMIFTVADLNAMGITKGRIDSIALDVAQKNSFGGFYINVKMGCTPLTQLTSFIPNGELKQVYSSPAYNTLIGWNSFPLQTPFVWDGITSLVIDICFFNGQFNTIGSDPVNYTTVTNPQFFTQNSNYGGCELPNVQSPTAAFGSAILPNVRFSLCDIPTKVWQYAWSPSNFIYDSTAGSTTAYVNNTATYHVYTKGGNKCVVTDSVTVTLSVHGVNVYPADTVICEGDSYLARAIGFGNSNSETFTWTDEFGGSTGLSCTNCSAPVITPPTGGTFKYYCLRTDGYGCTDLDSTIVLTNPRPTVSIINGDSITIKYGQEVNLIATGAERYNWTPVWGTSNPNTATTVVNPQEPTLYTVYGLNGSGCRNSDSIYVNIDYRDNLWVPSAFTPDGDGTNDIFRIANLTFQKVQEFKVMNRWGQEIFSATDNRGWNGTFKGKAQDPATYYYLIKVAYPDGYTQTFKGDVTLVR